MAKRYCLALDLNDDPQSIAEYEAHHQKVWPEIIDSIRSAGILEMEIYRTGNRLFMIMETDDGFSFEKKGEADNQNPTVQAWENLMWQYQKALPGTAPGEKWQLLKRIFQLNAIEPTA